MKKKPTKELKIKPYHLFRKNPTQHPQKIVFKENDTHTLAEINSYLTSRENQVPDTQTPPTQQNKEHLYAEIDSYFAQRENTTTTPQKLHFQKNKGKFLVKKTPTTYKIIHILTENIVELFLLIIGLLFFLQPTISNIQNGLTLILISTYLMFLMTDEKNTPLTTQKNNEPPPPLSHTNNQNDSPNKKPHKTIQKLQSLPLSNKISIVLILWTLLLYISIKDLEIFIILIFIGILIIREITDQHISNSYKKRLNIYIITFLLIYVILMSQKIIEILIT